MALRHRFGTLTLRLRPTAFVAWMLVTLAVAACGGGSGVHY